MAEKRASPPTDNPSGVKVKRMRKGTKSCAECRRRKIKCVFDPTRPDVCNDCHERGAECIDQDHAQDLATNSSEFQNQTLRGRVSQLEDLVKTLINKLDDNVPSPDRRKLSQNLTISHQQHESSSSLGYSLPTPASSHNAETPPYYSSSKTAAPATTNVATIQEKADLGTAPVLGLFQNDIIESQGGWHEEITTATAQDIPDLTTTDPTQEEGLRQLLISYLPSPRAIETITRDFAIWWDDWAATMPDIFAARGESLEQFVHRAVRSGSVLNLARCLLALALSLQQVPSDYDHVPLNLQLPPHELADFLAREVYKRVLSDDELAGTFDGVSALIIYSKFAVNAGRPRKAWVAHRRAVTFAQLLNLHRRSSRKTPSRDCTPATKELMWMQLYCFDQVMGLMFGQAYTLSPKQCDLDLTTESVGPEMSFMIQLATIAGRINDRNQDIAKVPLHKLLSTTIAIDQDLEELAQKMPMNWNDLSALPQFPSTEDSLRIMIQFFHAQVRALLHLPYMLKSSTEPSFQHNKQVAVEESRRMILLYEQIHVSKSGNYMCRVSDFQAFTAATLLLLNMLGFSREEYSETKEHPDWKHVRIVKDILRKSTAQSGAKVSEQCLRALDLFTCCNASDADSKTQPQTQTGQVMVPFYGTLVLGCGKSFQMPSAYKSNAYRHSNMPPTPPTGSNSNCTSPNSSCALPPHTSTDPGTTTSGYEEPYIGFDSFVNPLPYGDGSGYFPELDQREPLTFDQLNSNPIGFGGAWNSLPGAFNMDLDHDWNWYLNSNGM